MVSIDKAIQSMEILNSYCKERNHCDDCIFESVHCYLNHVEPENWDKYDLDRLAHCKKDLKRILDNTSLDKNSEEDKLILLKTITDVIRDIYGDT